MAQVIVRCVRSTGDREAPSINDALIVTQNDAVKRGKRWLDENYYLVKKRPMKVPHKSSSIVPRTWVTVTDGKLGLNAQKVKVKSYAITITAVSVWATMTTEQYSEFTT